ncbi:B3 domain-containing transcription factor VRN1-like [Tripterygium wilfordii]|uniref:B3 domain-containing transcription factor VRN1-like n=1 Tax=Tripterygium wilfordii TaxID=458696 RepID=UPI0018F7F9AC|nr:B3 domain-containing transcription factor VRN1-like [Tripterygium wilfordii]
MGSSSRTVDCFSSEKPRFLTIMNEHILSAGKLSIPRKFVTRYGINLLNMVILRVPSGAVWHVALLKEDGDVWLCRGWREFVEFYSLECGHLVLFQHEGCSEFDVLIFDKSATEIQYPFCHVCGEEPQSDGEYESSETENSEDDDSVQILEDFTTSRGAGKRAIAKSHPDMKMKMRDNYLPHCFGKEFGGGVKSTGWRRGKAGVVDRPRALTWSEKAEALKRVDFQSDNPYVTIVMQPRYVLGKYELAIPINFARNHLQIQHGEVILRISNGRTWSTTYNYYPNLARPKATISVGWREFVCNNSIKLGDVCVFELIRTHGITLNVFIF